MAIVRWISLPQKNRLEKTIHSFIVRYVRIFAAQKNLLVMQLFPKSFHKQLTVHKPLTLTDGI